MPAIGMVCISLYQCTTATIREVDVSAPSLEGHNVTDQDHRGDVLVPFFKDATTYADLAEGVGQRLNRYFVVHPADSTGRNLTTANRSTRGNATSSFENARSRCACCFDGAFVCSRCLAKSGRGGVHRHPNSSESYADEYPEIVVQKFTRARTVITEKHGTPTHEEVSFASKVVEGKHRCFFFLRARGSALTGKLLQRREDGSIARPLVGRDHMCESSLEAPDASDRMDEQGYAQHLEIKVGAFLLRIGTRADQRFEEIAQRLRQRNLHVERIFDGVSGASILPCELVRHFSGYISALCGAVDKSYVCANGDASVECEDMDLATLFSATVLPHTHCRNTVWLSSTSDHQGGAFVPTQGLDSARNSRKSFIELNSFDALSDENIPGSVNSLTPLGDGMHHGQFEYILSSTSSASAMAEDNEAVSSPSLACSSEESSRPNASLVYVSDDATITRGGDLRREASDSSNDDVWQQVVQFGARGVSPIMVTQQMLPDLCLDYSEEEEEEDEC